jgi:hypothetical protein
MVSYLARPQTAAEFINRDRRGPDSPSTTELSQSINLNNVTKRPALKTKFKVCGGQEKSIGGDSEVLRIIGK